MNTLRRFFEGSTTVPGGTAWYLADLGEVRGKQDLFTRQAPQRLKTPREHALIESTVSSNRIEGVTVDPGHDPAGLARAESGRRGGLRGARPGGPLAEERVITLM